MYINRKSIIAHIRFQTQSMFRTSISKRQLKRPSVNANNPKNPKCNILYKSFYPILTLDCVKQHEYEKNTSLALKILTETRSERSDCAVSSSSVAILPGSRSLWESNMAIVKQTENWCLPSGKR